MPRGLTEAEKFNIRYPNPKKIDNMPDKLRWYRYNKSLHQSQVAEYAGIDRTTYISYENGSVAFYPLDILSRIAELFEIDIKLLLDDYHRFLYDGQGQQVKALRKSMRLTQDEFATVMNVCDTTVRRWEKEYMRVMPDIWKQLCKMSG